MIDLSKCTRGDILACKHDTICEYLHPLPEEHNYDHQVKYLRLKGDYVLPDDMGNGTRCNDGFVYRKNRRDTDLDVVQIIHINR